MSTPGSYGQIGQLFSKDTQAIFYNWQVGVHRCFDCRSHRQSCVSRPFPPLTDRAGACRKQLPVQRMLDFDFLCGESPRLWLLVAACRSCCCWLGYSLQHSKSAVLLPSSSCCCFLPPDPAVHLPCATGRTTPSVAAIVQPGASRGSFQKLFFGREEVAIPQYASISDAVAAHPKADVFINFSSYRSAFESSLDALKQPTIRVVAIIAEGVPERDTKALIAYARSNAKVIIGPATVGGVQAGAFKIGDAAGTLENIVACKLYRPGSVGFVSKSGGMSNEVRGQK